MRYYSHAPSKTSQTAHHPHHLHASTYLCSQYLVTSYQKCCIVVMRIMLLHLADPKKRPHSDDNRLVLGQACRPITCNATHACSPATH
jgi:hypothetical protein